MPFYEYECGRGHIRQVRQTSYEPRPDIPCDCGKPARLKISLSDFRMAVPLTVVQDLGGGRGYQVLDKKADSGITPKPGQPYKTAKEVEREG